MRNNMIRKSSRGVEVDFEKLQIEQEKNIAVGNTRTNARGDQLGKGGKIEKTADQIAREHYNQNNPKAVKKASIKIDAAKEELPVGLEPQTTKKYAPAPTPTFSENLETDSEV
jgi:hypothetical protein